jgi:glycosyltransferase involved in cell wall biosynthesis
MMDMMHQADHTFIIPAYTNSPFIEECIQSLKGQTVPSKILITTSTPSPYLSAIARRYHLEIYVHDQGGSIAGDWNFAYTMCQTKYLTLAHQDDVYKPEYTEKCLSNLEKPGNKDALILFTDYNETPSQSARKKSFVLFTKKILLLPFLFKRQIKSHFLKRMILTFGNPISCPTVMYNMQNLGPFEFSKDYTYAIDWEAWLRLSRQQGQFVYVNRKLMFHRLHPGSETSLQIRNSNRLYEEEKIFQQIWNKRIARWLMFFYRHGSANQTDQTSS